MKFALVALSLAPFLAAPSPRVEDPAPKPAVEKKETPPVYDESAVGADQIAAALARSKKENRRVLIHWGANWCGWCKLLAQLEKSDKDISKELLYEYDVVKIDIGRWNKHMDLADKYGANLMSGVPFLTILDADGKVLANQETGSLELKGDGAKGHDPAKVLAFLKDHQAPHLDSKKLFDAALAQAKSSGKRVFLHFGAPWCGWCHKLEDWMARPEIASVLGKDFIDVKVDTDRTIGGQDMLTSMSGSEKGGIPWFVFLDADGKTLATSDGPAGNIGFPTDPPELAHFQAMLEKARAKITPDEIAALVASLAPKKDVR